MIIERFFGKGREAKGKPRSKDEANPRRSPGKPAETEAPVPRIEATDAPAAMASLAVVTDSNEKGRIVPFLRARSQSFYPGLAIAALASFTAATMLG